LGSVGGEHRSKDTAGSPWENGYYKSFNSKLRAEFLNGEIFYSIKELRLGADLAFLAGEARANLESFNPRPVWVATIEFP